MTTIFGKCVKLCKSLHSRHESADEPRRFLIIFKYLEFHATMEKVNDDDCGCDSHLQNSNVCSCPKVRQMLPSYQHSRCLLMANKFNSLTFKVCLRSLSVGKLQAVFVIGKHRFPKLTTTRNMSLL